MTEPAGTMIIAGTPTIGSGKQVHATDPSTGSSLEPAFAHGDASHVEQACGAAAEAFGEYRRTPLADRVRFLERIADNIDGVGDTVVERAHSETGRPLTRLHGERARTTGQMRMFAKLLRDGDLEVPRVDPALTTPRPEGRGFPSDSRRNVPASSPTAPSGRTPVEV